jgi:phosphoribosylglycinamide formyltransferase-1
VLVSGTGTLLQALLDACADPVFGATVVAVGADRPGVGGLERAERAGVPTFVHPYAPGLDGVADRDAWDRGLAERVGGFAPDLVVSAGFLKLVGRHFLAAHGGRTINSHPALLPAFPGMHGVRDALAYGVKISGATVFAVDAGVDSGAVLDQVAVPVLDGDTEDLLHERIKVAERALLVSTVHRLVTRRWRITDRLVHWD